MNILLHASKTSINEADTNGDTPLHLALQSQCHRLFNYNYPLKESHLEAMFTLLKHGADPSKQNKEEDLPLDLVHPHVAAIGDSTSNSHCAKPLFLTYCWLVIAKSPSSYQSFTSFFQLLETTESDLIESGVDPKDARDLAEAAKLYLNEIGTCRRRLYHGTITTFI